MNNVERINSLLELIGLSVTIMLVLFCIFAIIMFFVEWKKYCEKAENHLNAIRILTENIEDYLYDSSEEDEQEDNEEDKDDIT